MQGLLFNFNFYFPEEFDNYMQQDAHEFLNFLINHINEIILGKIFFFLNFQIHVYIRLIFAKIEFS